MIEDADIKALAELARIGLKESEIEPLKKDISDILAYVSQINDFSAEPSSLEVPLNHNALRSDSLREGGDTMAKKEKAIVAQFPRSEGDYNVVRKIIQKDE